MEITRIRELAGLKKLTESNSKLMKDPKVTVEFRNIRPSDEMEFRKLARAGGAKRVEFMERAGRTVAAVDFIEEMWKDSNDKYVAFKSAWENRGKETVNEDHGKGFYVMVDGKEHCWCETKAEADEKALKLKEDGKNATVVPDKKEVKESAEEEITNEEEANTTDATEEEGAEESEEKDEEVKEAVVDNFVQDDTDKDNTVANRTGTEAMKNKKITVPAKVKSAVSSRISELKKAIEEYDEKGYNDQSQKQKAIECLEQIMDHLASGDVEGLKHAQIYFGTLMSPITDLIPSQLVLFLANAEAVKEQEDKDRVAILKRHIAYHESSMRLCDKGSTSYKDHQKALERYKEELAQYTPVNEAYNRDFSHDDEIGHHRLNQIIQKLADKLEFVTDKNDDETNSAIASWCQHNAGKAFWGSLADYLSEKGFHKAAYMMDEHSAESGY